MLDTSAADELAKFQKDDEADMTAAQSFAPDVKIKTCVAGEFLCYHNLELPRQFIEYIKPNQFAAIWGPGGNGIAPHITNVGRREPKVMAFEAQCAGINITMSSGQTHNIPCTRWQTDILLNSLNYAWKHGVA